MLRFPSILAGLLSCVLVTLADDNNAVRGTSDRLLNVPADYRALNGSENKPDPNVKLIGPAGLQEALTVSIYVRRRSDVLSPDDADAWTKKPRKERTYLTQEQYAEKYGASREDLKLVKDFANDQGLKVEDENLRRRVVAVSGTVAQMEKAFGVQINRYESSAGKYMSYEGPLYLPANLSEIVEGIFGLDNRPIARPPFKGSAGQTNAPLTPPQVAKLYKFPRQRADGQTIGLLEFGGGYRDSDVKEYFEQVVGLRVPKVTWIGVDGAGNQPGSDYFSDREVILDISVAGAVAPEATIVVYFAPNTDRGWIDLVTTAIDDNPAILSCSWGAEEDEWKPSTIKGIRGALKPAASLGITFFAMSGDCGSEQPAKVFYPASDPSTTGCGGTWVKDVSGTTFTEKAWLKSGGGISNVFDLPSWQNSARIPRSVNPPGHIGRGVPDVAGNADPRSGYMLILDSKSVGPVGGASAVPPLYAGLVARLNATLKSRVGFLNDVLYKSAHGNVCRDVTSGSNGAYNAGPGWDAVTGWGSIVGDKLSNALP